MKRSTSRTIVSTLAGCLVCSCLCAPVYWRARIVCFFAFVYHNFLPFVLLTLCHSCCSLRLVGFSGLTHTQSRSTNAGNVSNTYMLPCCTLMHMHTHTHTQPSLPTAMLNTKSHLLSFGTTFPELLAHSGWSCMLLVGCLFLFSFVHYCLCFVRMKKRQKRREDWSRRKGVIEGWGKERNKRWEDVITKRMPLRGCVSTLILFWPSLYRTNIVSLESLNPYSWFDEGVGTKVRVWLFLSFAISFGRYAFCTSHVHSGASTITETWSSRAVEEGVGAVVE